MGAGIHGANDGGGDLALTRSAEDEAVTDTERADLIAKMEEELRPMLTPECPHCQTILAPERLSEGRYLCPCCAREFTWPIESW